MRDQKTASSQPAPAPAAHLIIRLRPSRDSGFDRLEGVIAGGRLSGESAHHALAVRGHRLDLDLSAAHSPDLVLPVPAGAYEQLDLTVRRLRVHRIGGEWREVARDEALRLRVRLEIAPGQAAVLSLRIDVASLAERGLARSVAPEVEPLERESLSVLEARDGQTVRLQMRAADVALAGEARLRIPRATLPAGTAVTLEEAKEREFPPLFRGQRRVGRAIVAKTGAAPGRPLELTVPYDAAEAARTGADVRRLVVLQLDDDRLRYRELRPHGFDVTAGTLTVAIASTSTFMPCTEGIRVDEPETIVNAAGEVLSYRSTDTITVAGQAADPRAAVMLLGASFVRSWVQEGWFAFEEVRLGGGDTVLTLQATVEGLLAHECQILVRRALPPKFVGRPQRNSGVDLAFIGEATPAVASIALVDGRFPNDDGTASEEELGPNLAAWQRGLERLVPQLHVFDASANGWRAKRLLANTFFENEIARLAIRSLENDNDPVAVDANLPEEVRFLRAFEAHLSQPPGGIIRTPLGPVRVNEAYRRLVLLTAAARFRTREFTISPVTPVAPLGADAVGVAYVRTTMAGLDAMAGTSMGDRLAELYATRIVIFGETRPAGGVLIGDLVFAGVTAAGLRDSEVVAGGIWGASIAAQVNPVTGRPALLALAAQPDDEDGARCSLELFQRDAGGDWARETVWSDRPIVDADLAFDGAGQAAIVAVTAGSVASKGHLFALRRAGGAWSATPIVHSLEGLFENSDAGMWARIAFDAAERPLVAFTVDAGAGVVWGVGRLDGAPADFRRLPVAMEATLFGISSAARDEFLPPGVAQQTGLSFAHFACSLSRGADGRLWLAYGSGVTRLVEIETDDGIALRDHSVDVDRSTGFFPGLAVRGSSPAIAYKDRFGVASSGADEPDLVREPDVHYFATEHGNFVPTTTAFPAVAGFESIALMLDAFGPTVPLGREVFQTLAGLALLDLLAALGGEQANLVARAARAFLPTLLMNGVISLTLVPEDDDDNPGFVPLALETSHPSVVDILRALPARPQILEVTVANTSATDDLVSLSFTSFGPLFRLDSMFRSALDAGMLAAGVRTRFAEVGITLGSSARVRVLTAGSRWAITETLRPSVDEGEYERRFLIRAGDQNLSVSLPSLVTAVGREDERDADTRQRIPLGLPIAIWDVLGVLARDFTANLPSFPDELGRADVVRLTGIRLSYRGHLGDQTQQGLIRFTMSIPELFAEGDLFEARSTGGSSVEFDISPHVFESRLTWSVRTVTARLAHIDVDTELGFVGIIGVVAAVVTGQPLLALALLVDPIAGSIATSKVNERKELQIGGLPALLTTLFAEYARDRFTNAEPPPLDAVLLRDRTLYAWFRRPAGPRASSLEVAPRAISFGSQRVGDAPVQRNVLLFATGHLAVLVREVALRTPSAEFAVVAPAGWPRVLAPGAAEIVTLQFSARGPADFRDNTLEVRYNTKETASVRLAANVLPPRQPAARVQPSSIQFGLVPVGGANDRGADVFNDGDGPLELRAARIEGAAADAAVYTLTFAPATVAPGRSHRVLVRFRPVAAVAGGHVVTLVLETNDPANARIDLPVSGTGFTSQLYVAPQRIDFGDAPTLPPGLGRGRGLTLANTGVADLNIEAASFRVLDAAGAASPHFALYTPAGVPIPQAAVRLRSGEQMSVTVRFRPTVAGNHAATFTVRSDDPARPAVAVEFTGRGV